MYIKFRVLAQKHFINSIVTKREHLFTLRIISGLLSVLSDQLSQLWFLGFLENRLNKSLFLSSEFIVTEIGG